MTLLEKLIIPSLFWCGGSLNLTRSQMNSLDIHRRRMLRPMVRIRWQSEEDPELYLRRVNSMITHLFKRFGITKWSDLYLKFQGAWGGHIAKMQLYDNSRLALCLLNYRSLRWIRTEVKRTGSQGHMKRFKTWRWEAAFEHLFGKGKNWHTFAYDRSEWKTLLEKFVTHRRLFRFLEAE